MSLRSIILGTLVSGLALPAVADEPDGPWHRTYETARDTANERGMPLLLHFYADWCGPCRRMEKDVLNSAEVRDQLGTSIVAVRINVDQRPDLAERFAVSGLPADLIVAPEGTTLGSHNGYLASADYVALIRSHVARPDANCPNAIQPVAALDEPESMPGLKGFSPVSITRDRVWRKGDSQYAWTYRGVVYHLVDAEELRLLQADPHQYVPRLEGYDPLELATTNRLVSGDIRYGAFYRQGLYLHSSVENRERFIESPNQYIDQAQNVLSLGAEAVTMLPPAR